ncbi:hotdog fold thioesterase [Kocuria sp.]|uniref:hotdog fold thioesterase n=1 Tax=Kocuria TaxID=57493 RepID=UPI0025C27B38|nr:hotdog fold thioesterase [Kocuria sp.]
MGESATTTEAASELAGDFVTAMLAADRSRGRLGISGADTEPGRAAVELTVEPDMVNGLGLAHGGFVFALADYAFACAANSVIPGVATTEAQISFLAPARMGERLVAEAGVSFSSGRRVIVDVTVRAGERTVALFRGTGRAAATVTGE